MLQHPFGYMPRDVHNRLVAGLSRFCKACNEGVSVVVPTTFNVCFGLDHPPHGFETCTRLRRIGRLGLTGWKNEPLWIDLVEFLVVPGGIRLQDLQDEGVQRDCSAGSGIAFGLSDHQVSFPEMEATPLELTKLIARRIAALLLHGPELDSTYEQIERATISWPAHESGGHLA